MNRPTGVTILAVLHFLGAGLYVLAGIFFMVGMGIAGAAAGSSDAEGAAGVGGMLAGMGAIAGVVMIVLAIIPGLIGWGLWTLKNWARIVTIVLTGLGLVFIVLGLVGSLMAMEIVSLVMNLCFAALYAWIIMYLLKPHVKQAFGAA